MANVKITDLTTHTNPASTDVLPIVDVGADITKKVSIADLLENAGSGTASAPGVAFDGDSNTGIFRPGPDELGIATGGTERARFTGGYMRLASGTGGIQFNGDTAAANALDDYEEGTWALTGGTWNLAGGFYVKTGNTVLVSGWAAAQGGQVLSLDEIGGLPFAYAGGRAGNGSYMVFEGLNNPFVGATIVPGGYGNTMNSGPTSLRFIPAFSRQNSGNNGGDRIQFTVIYQV